MINVIKIAVGGQLVKKEIKELLERLGNQSIQADIFTDMDASAKVKSGEYDFYMGACQSGAGGALAMAYAIIGRDKCSTIANAVKKPTAESVSKDINNGVKAFGFTNDRYELAVEAFVSAIKL
ncbi:TPA: DUF2620 family protein [Salmonella enterica subsp. enterica serovar Muenchen]|nr:DUF2620 family protein [Salmonella enterica]EBR9313118.1 DUF2620 family protein [Salmonella enterica subsp. enterica serovar Muenchen]ECJ4482685.1 DUF2620 domain-containing protein [Salmonella enterica subsp. diarizonae]EBY3556159.1 DUF2620 family protein [Salmonella enterica subsp. enterica serovar Muenchen]ECG0447062.1 DUF2620 family protein [Salmonella enterica]